MVKFIRFITIVLLFFLGISAIYGGGTLVIDPSGKLLGMPISHLEHSPFSSFLIPGLILFLFNGVSAIIIAVMAIRKHRLFTLLVICQGIVQVMWILIQVAMLRSTSVLHFICFAVGALLIIAGIILRKKAKEK
jgi:hypothetical protein